MHGRRRQNTGSGVEDFGKLADGAKLVLAKRGEGCGGRRVGQVFNQVAGSALGVVGGGCLGHGSNVGEKINGLGDMFGRRGRYVNVVALVVLGVCTDVPAVDAVTGSGAADGRGFMD